MQGFGNSMNQVTGSAGTNNTKPTRRRKRTVGRKGMWTRQYHDVVSDMPTYKVVYKEPPPR